MGIMLLSVVRLPAGLVILRVAAADRPWTLCRDPVICRTGFSAAFAMIQLVIAEYFTGPSCGKILGMFTMAGSIAGSAGIPYLGRLRVDDVSKLPVINHMIMLCIVVAAIVGELLVQRRPGPATVTGPQERI